MTFHLTALADPASSATALTRRLAWLASAPDGIPLGTAFLRLFTSPEQSHLCELSLDVHPAERRRGVGSALLTAAADAARADGRRALLAQADEGSPGDAFLTARGFERALVLDFGRLDLTAKAEAAPEADPDAATTSTATAAGAAAAAITSTAAAGAAAAAAGVPAGPVGTGPVGTGPVGTGPVGTDRTAAVPDGYRLISWVGSCPEEWLSGYTRSRTAMDDMPMGDTGFGTVVWDEARMLAAAKAVADRGELLHTVAAVETATGEIVGFSELVLPADRTGDGQHYGTAVQPAHRRRGLARALKAEAIRWTRAGHPAITGLLTDTADNNTGMQAVNRALGYRTTHRAVEFRLAL